MSFLLALLLLLLAPFQSAHADNHDVAGYWLTENERAVIKIEPCADSICGNIYWIIEGGMQFDDFNKDEMLKGRPMCGLEILSDFDKAGENDWESGTIYKADDGDIYKANVELQEDGTLKVRGYLGMPFLGKTQIWTRVSASDYKQCTPAKR